jgi:isopenicillin N synthase-like dioxygenase
VVFGGESLGALTANRFIPTMHEVSNLSGARSSVAFQLLARSDTELLPVSLDQEAETAGAFVQRISASRVSSNFSVGKGRTV